MLCRTCWLWLGTNLWDAIWVWKSTFWSQIWIFSQKISAKSVTNTVKDFTETLKTSGRQVCWQIFAGHWRWIYPKPNTDKSHKPLNFRRRFLLVSWACKVLLCTCKFLCVFETLSYRKILYTYKNSAQKVLISSFIEFHGTKKLNFVDQEIAGKLEG